MADKDPSPGHSMFGLNDAPTREVPSPEAVPTATQPGVPQYVLVQQQQYVVVNRT